MAANIYIIKKIIIKKNHQFSNLLMQISNMHISFRIYNIASHSLTNSYTFLAFKNEVLKTKKASVWETYNTLVGKQDSNKQMHEAGSAPTDGVSLLPLVPLQTVSSFIRNRELTKSFHTKTY